MEPRSTLDELFGNNGVRIALVGVLAILALYLFAETIKVTQDFGKTDTSNVATITVTGTGKATASPNLAEISFTVQETASAVATAQDAATKRTNDALAAIKKLGIEDRDVQTSGYNVNPEYATPACPPGAYCPASSGKITGYQVSQTIDVKVRDTNKTGAVLQALGTLGVQNISGPNFMVDDTSMVDAEARGKAIADARAKASVLAGQLGVHLGKVVGFSEGGASPYPMFTAGVAKSAALDSVAPAPSVPVGQNETSSSVTVTYEIR